MEAVRGWSGRSCLEGAGGAAEAIIVTESRFQTRRARAKLFTIYYGPIGNLTMLRVRCRYSFCSFKAQMTKETSKKLLNFSIISVYALAILKLSYNRNFILHTLKVLALLSTIRSRSAR